jgi:hypothetical protein
MRRAGKRKQQGSQALRVVWEEMPTANGEANLLQALRILLREDLPEEVTNEAPRQLTFWD